MIIEVLRADIGGTISRVEEAGAVVRRQNVGEKRRRFQPHMKFLTHSIVSECKSAKTVVVDRVHDEFEQRLAELELARFLAILVSQNGRKKAEGAGNILQLNSR